MRNAMYISVIGLWISMSPVAHVDAVGAERDQAIKGQRELTWRFAYDDAGRITRTVGPDGKETTVHYKLDDKGLVQQIVVESSDSSTVTLRFDPFGRRVSMTDAAGTVRYEYDTSNHLIAVRREGVPAITYGYDTLDRVKTLKVGDFYCVEYAYDFLGRLASMKTPVGVVGYEYLTGQGQVVRTLPNGVKTFWAYEVNGQLRQITHGFFRDPQDNRYVVLAGYTYEYRPDGLIKVICERSARRELTTAYEYDTAGRLVRASESGGRQYSYEYDPVGNRLRAMSAGRPPQVCTYDWAGRISTLDGNPCEHDAAGNLTSYAGKDGVHTFRFNTMNLLKSAAVGDVKVEYEYDGDGCVIARTIGGKKTTFIPDPTADVWRPLLKIDPDGRRMLYVWEGDLPLAAIRDKEAEFFLQDYLGSVRLVVDQTGKITQQRDYDSFGVLRGAGSEPGLRPGFSGLFFDADTSVTLTRARTYVAGLGRHLQPEVRSSAFSGVSRVSGPFVYCHGDPINYADRNGLSEEPALSAWNNYINNRPNRRHVERMLILGVFHSPEDARSLIDEGVRDPFGRPYTEVLASSPDGVAVFDVLRCVVNNLGIPVHGYQLGGTTTLEGRYHVAQLDLHSQGVDAGINLLAEGVLTADVINIYAPPGGDSRWYVNSEKVRNAIAGARTVNIFINASDRITKLNISGFPAQVGGIEGVGVGFLFKQLFGAVSEPVVNIYRFHTEDGKDTVTRKGNVTTHELYNAPKGGHSLFFLNEQTGEGQDYLKNVQWYFGRGAQNGGDGGAVIGAMASTSFSVPPDWEVEDMGVQPDGQHWVLVRPANSTEESIPVLLTREGEDPDNVARWMSDMAEHIYPGQKTIMLLYGNPNDEQNKGKIAALKRRGYTNEDIFVLGSDGSLYDGTGALVQAGFVEQSGGDNAKPVLALGQAAYKIQEQTGRKVVADPVESDDRVSRSGTGQDYRSGENEDHRYWFFPPFLEEAGIGIPPRVRDDHGDGWRGGWDNWGVMGLPEGVLASTTGPGKRGGRGGGITWPPSWHPPRRRGIPPGPQPKPGWKPPSGGSQTRSSWGGGLAPSNVGGVYLGGAGKLLEGIGLLDGIALDQNNNVVLLGSAGDEIKLPALRVDDVVTVFRSVYLHGEGPTVTIDPNPENPEESAMLIRHSKATEDTYVGWVLYQADRLMKGYTLGVDNLTGRDVESSVPRYREIVDTIYFGGGDPEKQQREGHWERFWIVPVEARRFSAPGKELTLFDVPLKVNTQTMKWENGKLVDNPLGKSSPGALAFTEWFATNYDLVARERFLTPPPESGIAGPVPIYTELRRIALITAIAEKLRDQGTPLPFWMRDYEVRPVPFEKSTPGLKVTRSSQTMVARIFGGVNLSLSDEDLHDYTAKSDLSKLPATDQKVVREKVELAGSLEQVMQTEMASSEPLKVQAIKHRGALHQAVALPGAQTRALASCRLDEVDLEVPVEGGRTIQLVRSYNSFFDPTGLWGKGWALDLPCLNEIKVPVHRDAKQVQYQVAYELITPLNSTYARFSRIEEVSELNNSRLQVPDQACEFFGLADARPEFLSGPTRQLIRKDGGTWHFSQAGDLVATEQGGFRIVYERDEKGRVTQIIGLLGRRRLASIELHYDAAGRLESAKASGSRRESVVRYEYNDANRLVGASFDSGRLGYRYDGSWVTTVTFRAEASDNKNVDEMTMRRFEYNASGQLVAEVDTSGARTEYRVTSDSKGNEITITYPGSVSKADSFRYDHGFRPVEARYTDGTRASWTYPDGGGVALEVLDPDGEKVRLIESADGRRRTLELGKDQKVTGQYDSARRLTSVIENGRTVLRQEWSPDGRLLVTSNQTRAAHLEYDPDGLVSRVLLAPPEERGQFKNWQEMKLDPVGRLREITDSRGLQVLADYDGSGELAAVICKREGKNYGFQITRAQSGRIREVESSWATERYAYDAAGALQRVDIERSGSNASIEWQSGQVRKLTQFDGGQVRVDYYKEASRQDLLREVQMPNDLRLSYDYDQQRRPSRIDVHGAYRMEFAYDGQGRLSSLTQSPRSE